MEWRLIDLEKADPYMAQTFYEAVAEAVDTGASGNTVLFVQPSSPYACLGFHQELEKEIDVEFCKRHSLPIIRRSQGGGATYLNSDQLFYQVVARKESSAVPKSVEELFERFLSVTVYVYKALGLPAEFKALNDVIVDNKKISGNGAGEYGEGTTILVGNLILDLDYDSMAGVLKVPDEKFRDKMAKSMREWVTSIQRELGYTLPIDRLKELLIEGYGKVLGIKLLQSDPSEQEMKIWEEKVKPRHLSQEWLQMPELRRRPEEGRTVKIADGVRVLEVSHKAKKLIRLRVELIGDIILDLKITGDFFMIPETALTVLENKLKRVKLDRQIIQDKVNEFFEETGVETPGITPNDFTDTVMKLKEMAETYQPAIYPFKKEKND